MANTKSTKRALLASVLSLILCLSMLVGTTFAWFTDSVTSANNVIVAGNLDLTLEYWNGTEWADVEGSDEILDADALWEPGYTQVVYFKLTNVGSLALKYQMGVNIVSETAGVNVYGEEFLLSDYIYFDVVEGVDGSTAPFADRDEAMENATETVLISDGYSKSGNLVADAAPVYLAMIVYMPTTVGNVANHNGTDVPEILLGVNAIATQYTNESDSFDEYYDGGAAWLQDAEIDWYTENPDATEFTIGSAEELAGLAAIVNGTTGATTYGARAATLVDDFAGKTITLTSDIDLNNRLWTPIGSLEYDRDGQSYSNIVAFKGTFDGQGHTISNLKINTPNTEGAGLFACAEQATIQNLTMNNVDIVAGSHAAAILGRGTTYGKLTTITNCHVTGKINIQIDWAYAGAVVGKANTLSISNCTVVPEGTGVITAANRNAVGSLIGWVEQPATIDNCSAENMKLTGWANIGSITGFLSQGTTISNCTAENIELTKTRVEGHPTIGMIAGGFCYSATQTITVANNTAKNITLNGTHIAAPASANILYGAEFYGNANSNFVLENNVTENITNNLVEVTKVSTADELANAIENGYNVVLANDIELTSDITVAAGQNVVINLNGHNITYTVPANEQTYHAIIVKGDLTVSGNGTIELVDNSGAEFSASYQSTAISVAGGTLTLNKGVVVSAKAGAEMAYAVDVNTTLGKSVLNVNGATLKSSYIGVRIFNNNKTEKGIVNYNSGVISGEKKGYDIWAQNMSNPAENAVVNIADGISYTSEALSGVMYYIAD